MEHGKPLIGISADWQDDRRYGAAFLRVRPDYAEAIRASGGIPVIMPIITDEDVIQSLLGKLDGILLSGGGDIDPSFYHEDPSPFTRRIVLSRDLFEASLIRSAAQNDKPLLAICRGHQMLNVALGGSLYQDLQSMFSPSIKHYNEPLEGGFDNQAHQVTVTAGSKLAASMGLEGGLTFHVNSLHHQGVKDLAPTLKATALAEDGLIEGIESPDNRFLIGVQWHPESLYLRDEAMHNLFKSFVRSAESL